jgi:hypothetical protein
MVLAVAQVAALFLAQPFIPYAGTAATAALILVLLADDRRPRRPLVAGLVALTLAAFVVDGWHGGYGWPVGLPDLDGWVGVVAGLALAAAGALLALAMLGAVGLPRRKRHVVAVVVAGGLAAVAAVGLILLGLQSWRPAPGPALMTALLPLVAALVLVPVAAAANWVGGRRWIGVALVPMVVALAAGVLGAFENSGFRAGGAMFAADDVVTMQFAIVEAAPYREPGSAEEFAERLAGALQDDGYQILSAEKYEAHDVALAYPPTWSAAWDGEIDWAQPLPALTALVFLLGLIPLVRADEADGLRAG